MTTRLNPNALVGMIGLALTLAGIIWQAGVLVGRLDAIDQREIQDTKRLEEGGDLRWRAIHDIDNRLRDDEIKAKR